MAHTPDPRRRRTWQTGSLCGLLALAAIAPARAQEACNLKVGEMPVTMVGTRPIATDSMLTRSEWPAV